MANEKKPTNPYAPYKGSDGRTHQGQTPQRSAPPVYHRPAAANTPYYTKSSVAARKKSKTMRIALISIVVVLTIILAVLIGGYIWLESLFQEGDSGKLTDEVVATAEEYKGDVVNILVCGIDYDAEDDGRDYAEGKGMTDLIMYVNFDVKNKKVNILQLPRDSYVGRNLSSSPTGKINAVFANGPNATNPISNLASLINEQYKLPIDYYVTVDIESFKAIYEAFNVSFGGIHMYVPWDVEYTDPKTGETVCIPQGNTVMDADHMEWILRQRKGYAQSDIKRLELQQYFYAAMFKAFKQLPPTDLFYFTKIFTAFVRTDMNATTAISLGTSLLKVDNADITIYRSPGGPITIDGEACYGVNPTNMAEMLNLHFRTYGVQEPVLGMLPTDFEYHNGEIYDQGKSMASVSAEGEETPAA